jgi:hypothetical protein
MKKTILFGLILCLAVMFIFAQNGGMSSEEIEETYKITGLPDGALTEGNPPTITSGTGILSQETGDVKLDGGNADASSYTGLITIGQGGGTIILNGKSCSFASGNVKIVNGKIVSLDKANIEEGDVDIDGNIIKGSGISYDEKTKRMTTTQKIEFDDGMVISTDKTYKPITLSTEAGGCGSLGNCVELDKSKGILQITAVDNTNIIVRADKETYAAYTTLNIFMPQDGSQIFIIDKGTGKQINVFNDLGQHDMAGFQVFKTIVMKRKDMPDQKMESDEGEEGGKHVTCLVKDEKQGDVEKGLEVLSLMDVYNAQPSDKLIETLEDPPEGLTYNQAEAIAKVLLNRHQVDDAWRDRIAHALNALGYWKT